MMRSSRQARVDMQLFNAAVDDLHAQKVRYGGAFGCTELIFVKRDEHRAVFSDTAPRFKARHAALRWSRWIED